ncbi:C40 family peptidase [Paenibacillus turpanensis]|uniref:C40 family peptidase n=1 Tax=Paenibacillus turpanensis TaxID=2689078 RepID=UPI00140C2807|nr:C40 family peptidase [Paenibacillus turpanensis]
MRQLLATVIVISIVFVMTACARDHTDELRNQVQTENSTDNRLIDPQIANMDVLLKQGDLGMGRMDIHNRSARPFTAHSTLQQVFPNPAVPPINGSYAENAIATAKQFIGAPYQYGSERDNPSSFDCSDFTRWAFLSGIGMDLPLDSRSQARYVQAYSNRLYYNLNEARRGDLLFFTPFIGVDPDQYEHVTKSVNAVSHCGLYLGDGKMIHTASARTGGVRIDNVFGNHLQWRFFMGGSVLEQK